MSPPTALVPRRWTWVAVTAAVLLAALGSLVVLHQREQSARRAEAHAQLFAAEVRDAMREVAAVGDALPRDELARVLSPIVVDSVHRSVARLDRLDAQDPARAAELREDARQIEHLAMTARDAGSFSRALTRAAADAAATADDMARTQHRRAHVIAAESLVGSAMVLLFALAVLVALATRAQRAVLSTTRAHAAALAELAERDALTGLANRYKLTRDLAALEARVTPDAAVEIAICDLDGFKALNDTLGHEAGDALLVEASRRLVAAAGASGTVYRLGGDEFCVVSEPGAVAAAAIAGALESVATAGGRIVSGSVGAASWPAEAPSAREAMKLADERMYASKAAARAGRAA